MPSPFDQAALRNALPTLWFIWGAMFISLLLYAGIVAFFGATIRSQAPLDPATQQMLMSAFAALSFVNLGVAFFLRRRLLNRPNPKTSAATTRYAGGDAPPTATGRYATTMLIGLALCESIGIFGFVLFMLGARPEVFFAYIAAAGIAMPFFRPSLADLLRVAELDNSDGAVIKTR